MTHVVDSIAPEVIRVMEQIPELSPHLVSVKWLVESGRLGRPVYETKYPFPPSHDRGGEVQAQDLWDEK